MTTDDTRPADPAGEPRKAGAPTDGGLGPDARQAGAPAPAPTPDEATLAAIATPATVRRAPRFGAFLRAGVLLGGLLGWLLAILFSGTTGEARTGAILLTTGGMAVLGALVAAGLAALADRRSTRAAPADPRTTRAAGPGTGPDGGR